MNGFQLQKRSLRTQLLVMFLLLFALFEIVNLGFNLYTIQSGSRKQARQELNQALQIRQNSVEEWIRVKTSFLDSLANLQSFKQQDNLPALQNNLKAVGALNPEFVSIRLMDRYGIVRASSNGTSGDSKVSSVFYAASQNGGPVVSDFVQWEGDGDKGLVFAAPIMRGREFAGVVAGFVSRETIQRMLDGYTFGKSGRMLLMDHQGALVPEPDPKSVLAQGVGPSLFLSALHEEELVEFSDSDSSGKRLYGVYRPVLDGRFLLLGQIDRSEVMKPVREMVTDVAWTAGGFFLLGIAILVVFAGRMGATLKRMAESVQRVREGDLNHRMSLTRRMFRSSETEAIGLGFNRMAEALEGQMDVLKKLSSQYKESEERYRTVIEHSPDGIMIHTGGKIRLMNQAGARLLGAASPEELIGREILSIVHDSIAERVKLRIEELVSNGRTVMAPEERQYVRVDGSILEAESTACTILFNGEPSILVEFRDVTERKMTQQALKSSEELHRFIAENSTDMITRIDWSLRNLYVSQASFLLLGYKPEEMIGRSVLEFIDPECHPDLLKLREEILMPQPGDVPKLMTIRNRFINKAGKAVWMETTARAVKDGKGGIRELVAVSRDITVRMEMEAELKERSRRIQDILSSITDAFFALDQEWRFTYINETAEKLLGRSNQDLLGRTVWEEIPSIVGTAVEENFRRAEREQISVVSEQHFPNIRAWMEIRSFPGKEGISVYVSDITARRKLEEELRVNQEHLKQLLETTPSGILLFDSEGKYTFANRKAEEVLGLRREEITERTYMDASWSMYSAEGELFAEATHPFARTHRSGEPASGLELTLVRETGERIFLSCSTTPMAAPRGGLSSVLVTISDVTESKKLERELQKLSTMDGLTGIANRRHFNDVLNREWNRAGRLSKPLSLLMLDVDYFKSYNDTYGHQAGDESLKAVAALLSEAVGQDFDRVFRYGGEEFSLVLPNTNAEEAAAMAETIRRTLEQHAIPHRGSPNGVLTLSLGISTLIPNPLLGSETLLAQADMALYRAKQEGRNRVGTAV